MPKYQPLDPHSRRILSPILYTNMIGEIKLSIDTITLLGKETEFEVLEIK